MTVVDSVSVSPSRVTKPRQWSSPNVGAGTSTSTVCSHVDPAGSGSRRAKSNDAATSSAVRPTSPVTVMPLRVTVARFFTVTVTSYLPGPPSSWRSDSPKPDVTSSTSNVTARLSSMEAPGPASCTSPIG